MTTVPVIAFFNSKGGVGKTCLVYHLAWMYAILGLQVVAADLDPQANLTAAFLDEDRLENLWPKGGHPETVSGCIDPLLQATGDIAQPHLEYTESPFQTPLALVAGDLELARFEDQRSEAWLQCLTNDVRAFRVTSAFWHMLQAAAEIHQARVILLDLGPNLGSLNRAALLAAVIPLSPDLFSVQGLRTLGPTLKAWRSDWHDRQKHWEKLQTVIAPQNLTLPQGDMEPLGYIVIQHAIRMDLPVQMYGQWVARLPQEYQEAVLNQQHPQDREVSDDPNRLGVLKSYRSLMPLAREAHKPMFHLKPADGALGLHLRAVHSAIKTIASWR